MVQSKRPCTVSQDCLFNIKADPCETNNVSVEHPKLVKVMRDKLEDFQKTAMKPSNEPFDPEADPKYWGYVWTNWKDF